jgi:hypothetical protein
VVDTVVLDKKGSSIFGERQVFGFAIHFYQPNIFRYIEIENDGFTEWF